MKRRAPKRKNETKADKLRNKRRLKIAAYLVVCLFLLVFGVILTAQQQFTKWHLGRQNSELRDQVERLRGERDKLISQRETAASLPELKRSARKVGLVRDEANQIATNEVNRIQNVENASFRDKKSNPMLVKTAMTGRVAPTAAETKPVAKSKDQKRDGLVAAAAR